MTLRHALTLEAHMSSLWREGLHPWTRNVAEHGMTLASDRTLHLRRISRHYENFLILHLFYMIAFGVFLIFFGIIVILYPQFIAYIIAFLIISMGISIISTALAFRRYDNQSWKIGSYEIRKKK